MPRRTTSYPKYALHKASGQAIVRLGGRVYYLGPHRSDASIKEYDRHIAEWLGNDRRGAADPYSGITVQEAEGPSTSGTLAGSSG